MDIIPTILTQNEKEFSNTFNRLLTISNKIHIDIMDGTFVKNKSPPIQELPNLSQYKNHTFEAHLMVQQPLLYVPTLIDKGVKTIIAHKEATNNEDIIAISRYCKLTKTTFLLAYKSQSHLTAVNTYLKYINGIMLMGVHPGKNKSPFIQHTVDRVKRLRKKYPKLFIQVDGGANLHTVKLIKQAGANVYNSGSYVSLHDHPKLAIQQLKNALQQ